MEPLDMRPMPPRARHETIFECFGELAIGETPRLVNDQDSARFRQQLDATRPGRFRWDDAPTGPTTRLTSDTARRFEPRESTYSSTWSRIHAWQLRTTGASVPNRVLKFG
jgi:uncharacterized protein (DUF2249 family)